MSHQATVLYVMLSSPSDVRNKGAVDFIKQAIGNWNTLYTENEKVALVALDWKDAYPSMETTGQKIINAQILERCDILLALFWSQIGTPTENYVSGSVEELETHVKAGKPAMVYFIKEDIPLDSNTEQLEKLKKFKEQCQKSGLYRELDRIDESMKKAIMDDIYKYISEQNFKDNFVPKLESEASAKIQPLRLRPSLSKEAQEMLLLAAMSENDGLIIRARYIDGSQQFQVAGQVFGSESRREFALYDAARDELLHGGLIDASDDHHGNVAELTRAGWEYAGKLKAIKGAG